MGFDVTKKRIQQKAGQRDKRPAEQQLWPMFTVYLEQKRVRSTSFGITGKKDRKEHWVRVRAPYLISAPRRSQFLVSHL